jgi:uroporphyrin-III C-methyltransferase
LAEIAEIFKNEGKNKLPVAVIQSGTTVNEKVAIGTVDTIVDLVPKQGITSPALIVLGEVVSLHPKFELLGKFMTLLRRIMI